MKINKDKIAAKIATVVLIVQARFAALMTAMTMRSSPRTLKLSCFGVTLFLMAVSAGFIADAIMHKTPHTRLPILHIQTLPLQNDSRPHRVIIDSLTHEKIRRLEKFMDSLQRSGSGRRVYDSIIFRHPGLLDSAKELEKIYLSK